MFGVTSSAILAFKWRRELRGVLPNTSCRLRGGDPIQYEGSNQSGRY